MSPSRTESRRILPVAVAAGLVALLAASGLSGSTAGAGGSSAREQRSQVRAQQARVAAQVGDRNCAAELLGHERAARNAGLGLWGGPYYAVLNASAGPELRHVFLGS